jgi:hypothetical protein
MRNTHSREYPGGSHSVGPRCSVDNLQPVYSLVPAFPVAERSRKSAKTRFHAENSHGIIQA